MNELALFAGGGGGLLASRLLGWRTVCAVEIDPYCRSVLIARQRDGMLDRFPIWDDVKTFDAWPWKGAVDVISGGFPCQDISAAGKGKGLSGSRSGLVFDMLRIVEEIRPRFVFAENSPYLRTKGLGEIIERFIQMGYDCRWCVLGGWHVGAPHRRNRMWILAYANDVWERVFPINAEMAVSPVDAHTDSSVIREQQGRRQRAGEGAEDATFPRVISWWDKNRYTGVDDGLAHRMDRVRATGNGQIPGVAALAWETLSAGLI